VTTEGRDILKGCIGVLRLELIGESYVVRPCEKGIHLIQRACYRTLERGGQFVLLGRGLHSSTSQLNLSAFYGRGGARRGCVARVRGVLGGVQGVEGV
jgi:hypothetical protein